MTQAPALSQPQDRSRATLSAVLVIGVTLVALCLGWLVMNSVITRTVPINQSNVSANAPAGWMINYGLQGEEMVFTTADQLDQNHRYIVALMPGIPGGSVTDVFTNRTLNQGQNFSDYQVIDQSPAQVNGVEGFRVEYAYIKTGAYGMMPKVVRGVDYYVPKGEKVLVITMEDESENFNRSLDSFFNFLGSVRYSVGG